VLYLRSYDTMNAQIHPIGTDYSSVYDYLNCLGISPCWGWMNSNSTARDLTTAHANELNAVMPEIVAEQTYSNFKMYYLNESFNDAVQEWIDSGHSAVDLIEPVDGFHPSQTGIALLSDKVWQWMQQYYPEIIGPVNPHNEAIKALFGDQGGHE
jgi:acyloxyacyl hydrolase